MTQRCSAVLVFKESEKRIKKERKKFEIIKYELSNLELMILGSQQHKNWLGFSDGNKIAAAISIMMMVVTWYNHVRRS